MMIFCSIFFRGETQKDNLGKTEAAAKSDPNKKIVKFILEICLFKQIDGERKKRNSVGFGGEFCEDEKVTSEFESADSKNRRNNKLNSPFNVRLLHH